MTITDSDKPYDANGKSPAEIEHDIAETRAELGAVIDALERRMAPRHLLEQGMDRLRDTMNGNGGGIIGEILRGHPVPLALIGVGLGWLLVAGTAGDRISDAARQVASKTRDLAGGMIGQAEPGVTGASFGASEELAGYAYARTKPRLSAAAATAAETAGRARDGIARAIEDYPLALGILGIMAGAALAMMLPQSRIEERWIGPVRERVRERAGDLSREAAVRAQDVAERAVDSVADALKSTKGEGSI